MADSFKRSGIATTDCEGNKRALRDVMDDLMRAYGVEPEPDPDPLLTIELESEIAVPKVFYKGEEVTSKIQINFDWSTKGLKDPGGMKFNIEYGDDEGIIGQVGRRVGDLR